MTAYFPAQAVRAQGDGGALVRACPADGEWTPLRTATWTRAAYTGSCGPADGQPARAERRDDGPGRVDGAGYVRTHRARDGAK